MTLPHARIRAVNPDGTLTSEFRRALEAALVPAPTTVIETTDTSGKQDASELLDAIVTMEGVGVAIRQPGGSWRTRSLADSPTIGWTHPNGLTGNPTAAFTGDAADVPYDNTTSGLTATDVQGAIDEVAGGSGGSSEGFNPSTVYFLHEEFRTLAWYSTGQTSGTDAAITLAAPVAGRPGIVSLTTGTTTTGFAFETDVNANWLFFGQGEVEMWWDFTTPASLSDAVESYLVLIGTRDIAAGARTESISLAYSDSINGGNWAIESISGGVTSYVNGSTAPAANTRYRMRLVVNAAGTSAEVFLRPFGGVEFSVGTTAVIPAGGQRRTHGIFKQAGTASRSMSVDYATIWERFSPAR